jgi:hypothetical protein
MEIYQRGVEACGEDGDISMGFGPGHVVWEDENFDDHSIKACINEGLTHPDQYESETSEQIAVIVQSLRDLLEVPEEIRCCIPDDYDGDHPENFPPPAGIVMVNK